MTVSNRFDEEVIDLSGFGSNVRRGNDSSDSLRGGTGSETTETFSLRNIANAEESLANLWFNPVEENFANTADQEFTSILSDTENYASISRSSYNPINTSNPSNTFARNNSFKPSLTFGRRSGRN